MSFGKVIINAFIYIVFQSNIINLHFYDKLKLKWNYTLHRGIFMYNVRYIGFC